MDVGGREMEEGEGNGRWLKKIETYKTGWVVQVQVIKGVVELWPCF